MKINEQEVFIITESLRQYRDRQISMKVDPINTKELLDRFRNRKDNIENKRAVIRIAKVKKKLQQHPITGEILDGYGEKI
tara:strand:+ start:128 stop:367 length:240 start_codon:yes stop_codon:yes gene_type:complete